MGSEGGAISSSLTFDFPRSLGAVGAFGGDFGDGVFLGEDFREDFVGLGSLGGDNGGVRSLFDETLANTP